MRLLDETTFKRLDQIGKAVRDGVAASFARLGIEGSVVGEGSLLKVHFTSQPVTDYRSAYPSEAEEARLAKFNIALLNRGVIAAPNGLMALSTPMSDGDITAILEAVDGAIAEAGNHT